MLDPRNGEKLTDRDIIGPQRGNVGFGAPELQNEVVDREVEAGGAGGRTGCVPPSCCAREPWGRGRQGDRATRGGRRAGGGPGAGTRVGKPRLRRFNEFSL